MSRFWDEYGEKSWTEVGGTVLTKGDLGLGDADFVGLKTSFKALDKY